MVSECGRVLLLGSLSFVEVLPISIRWPWFQSWKQCEHGRVLCSFTPCPVRIGFQCIQIIWQSLIGSYPSFGSQHNELINDWRWLFLSYMSLSAIQIGVVGMLDPSTRHDSFKTILVPWESQMKISESWWINQLCDVRMWYCWWLKSGKLTSWGKGRLSHENSRFSTIPGAGFLNH